MLRLNTNADPGVSAAMFGEKKNLSQRHIVAHILQHLANMQSPRNIFSNYRPPPPNIVKIVDSKMVC